MSYHKYYEDDPEWGEFKKKSEIEFDIRYERAVKEYKEYIGSNPSAMEQLNKVASNMPFGMRLADFLKAVGNDRR